MNGRIFAMAAAAGLLTGAVALFAAGSATGQNSVLDWLFPGKEDDVFAACRGGAVAGDIGGPFTLLDHTGATVTDADIVTTPVILYFGYTFCPDVCPLDNMRNAIAVDILEERGIIATPVFISIDPRRDTPEIVGQYARNFHDRMIGLTGSPEQVAAASTAFRTYYREQEAEPGDDFYLVDHSTFSYILMPGHGFVDFARRSETPEEVADRIACFAAGTS